MQFNIPDGDHRARYICSKCKTIHYSNPTMVVGCIIEEDGKIMLCKRGIEPRLGFWNLPCGYLENGETVEEGALREVFEETGARVRLKNLHTVYSLPKENQVYLIFTATMLDPEYHTTEESTEIHFFAPKDIPWADLAFSSNSFALKNYIENHTHNKTHLGSFF